MTPSRVLVRESGRPALVALGAGALAALASGAGRLAWDGGVVPDPVTWTALLALSVPGTATLLVPAVVGFASAAPLRRWTAEGAWTGLRTTGWRGRDLAPAWLGLGLVGAVATAAAVHWAEPGARRAARTLASDASLELVPGVRVDVGEIELLETAASGAVLVSGPHWVATAGRGDVSLGTLVLDDGRAALLGESPAWVTFDRFEQSFTPTGRPDLAAATTGEVARAARRSEGAGRNAGVEWSIWWKRWLHPLSTLVLPLAVGPLAPRPRGPLALGAAAVGWLAAVRLGDGLAPAWGGLASAAFGPVFVAALALAAWATWRDR